MDKITIIVPVYNVENYLEECIESILNQTYKNLDIILIDDGSTDRSGEICESFKIKDKRIRVVHQKNQGVSAARNTGIELAKGEFIQFVDSDDFIENNMVETLYKIIKEKEADIVTCSHYIYIDGQVVQKHYSKEINVYDNKEAIKKLIIDENIRFYPVDKLYKKYLWKDIRFPVGRIFEDTVTTPKIFVKANKIVESDIPLYYYRKREGSITAKRTKKQKIEHINSVLEMHNYLAANVKGIEDYLNYSIVRATISAFRSIGYYDLKDLEGEQVVEELYQRTIEIMNDEKSAEFINKFCYNAIKIHLYYLLTDREEYIKNLKYLPDMYKK